MDFEKLGAFYLGRTRDADQGRTSDEPLLYDARHLTTHALCVGMTGSGKTGLCITLLEEAALDGIPALVIDPKGDMGNLLLTFPDLAPADFEPWIDASDAQRAGRNVAEQAADVAGRWQQGLAEWGQDGARIARLREAAEVLIYTPGGSAGLPLSLLRSFEAPARELVEDGEAFADRILSATSGLLGLLGIDADPLQSREAILVSNVLQHAWRAGRDLTLADLIREIQKPPFETLGVLDLETFYPAKERAALAMSLNGLLASPGFAQWLQGDRLDVSGLLWAPDGRPRVSILSIAHLSEAERMFFVTLLLNEVVAWMRTQSGTNGLRAILYMDEIFGYFPPTREPPSKKPMLTLLKQARAYGLGVVLATQNPVDLDYKGLSNTGTWFLGRLQTERDKQRVLDGLEGALTGQGKQFDRARLDALLSGLGKRVFLMNDVHEDGPVLFQTRQAMSYLCGPLSREHVRRLMEPVRAARAAQAAQGAQRRVTDARPVRAAAEPMPPAMPTIGGPAGSAHAAPQAARPLVPPGVEQRFVAPRGTPGAAARFVYHPTLVGVARLHFVRAAARLDTWQPWTATVALAADDGGPRWSAAELEPGERLPAGEPEPRPGVGFAAAPAALGNARAFADWRRELAAMLHRERTHVLWQSTAPRLMSEPGEDEGRFRARVGEALRNTRDDGIDKLRKRYAPKLQRAQERIRKSQEKVGRESEQYDEQRKGSWITLGGSLLGALVGRELKSSGNVRRAGTTARSFGRSAKERADIERAERDLAAQRAALATLEAEFEAELDALRGSVRPNDLALDEIVVRPRKGDLEVDELVLVWRPWRIAPDGTAGPAW